MSRLNWVCRCSSGRRSSDRPPIHILAGEKVCIQVISPAQAGSALAARQRSRMASGPVSTGLKTTGRGSAGSAPSPPAIRRACAATRSSASGPYRCWLPVTNQSAYSLIRPLTRPLICPLTCGSVFCLLTDPHGCDPALKGWAKLRSRR